MAYFHVSKTFICIALALVLCMQGTLADAITCERLNSSLCAFAVSSAGTRCVLEKRIRRGGREDFYCRTSDIKADKLMGYVEIDECITACGLDRNTVGISSDSLLEPRFTQKLCSPKCYQVCLNIVDLYFNLAAGEGLFLPKVCEAIEGNAGNRVSNIRSTGAAAGPVAAAPVSDSGEVACGPMWSSKVAFAPAPASF